MKKSELDKLIREEYVLQNKRLHYLRDYEEFETLIHKIQRDWMGGEITAEEAMQAISDNLR